MKKLNKIFCFILIFLYFALSAKSEEKDVIMNLMKRPLNYLDLGVINLEKDLEKSIDRIIKLFTSPLLTNLIEDRKDEVETSVVYNWRKTAVIASVSIPVSRGLQERDYLSSSNKCRELFDQVRYTLLRTQPQSTLSESQVASYLVERFYPPSNQPWALPESYRKSLVKVVFLEVVLRPTNKYALSQKVSPISCIGNLSVERSNIKVVYNSLNY
ncbi:MAG: hypothetical protein EBW08_01480 [Pelagibacteraceae bacterium]|jgi:hypothetical protein|nr:hypothetical protein [Pelagibacteraceae bacterium]NCV24017.1 hypothetical protein [Pseudomonadota bacterium]NCW79557.1 hypothetical protein [Pelagibacteraceae bacterium]